MLQKRDITTSDTPQNIGNGDNESEQVITVRCICSPISMLADYPEIIDTHHRLLLLFGLLGLQGAL